MTADNDPLREIVAAAKPRGVNVHAWKVCWNLADAPDAFVERMRREGRLQADVRGQTKPWLSPAHWSNFVQERDTMLELARRYELAGLHFDYIRYPNADYDYAPVARQRFEERIGRPVADWPADVRGGGPDEAAFLDWRAEQITRLVREVSAEAKAIRPGLRISAAVFPYYPQTRKTIGQNWLDWARRGYVDFLCPMSYTRDEQTFADWTADHLRFAAGTGVPIYPGIGATVAAWQSPAQTARQIRIARDLGASGYVLFHYDHTLATHHLPLLRMGVNRPR